MYENFIQRQFRRCLRVLELEDRCQQTKDFEQNFWDEIYMCHGVRIVFLSWLQPISFREARIYSDHLRDSEHPAKTDKIITLLYMVNSMVIGENVR